MSYAARLVAMSRGDVPRPPAEAPREEHVEVEVPPSPIAHTAPQPRSAPPARADSATAPTVPAPVARVVSAAPIAGEGETRIPPPQLPSRETVERHTIVEVAPATAPPTQRVPAALAAVERVAMPPQAMWLAEDREAADPLVASAGTDELRELMRAVRAWTSSPPTAIPVAAPAAVTPEAAAATVQPAPEPTQVSIGNVVITVEDAPATPARKRAATPQTASDRLARNHIRGG